MGEQIKNLGLYPMMFITGLVIIIFITLLVIFPALLVALVVVGVVIVAIGFINMLVWKRRERRTSETLKK